MGAMAADPCVGCRHLDPEGWCRRILQVHAVGEYLTGWRRECPERSAAPERRQLGLFGGGEKK